MLDSKIVKVSDICGGVVMLIHYRSDHWDGLPEDFAAELGEVKTEQEFFDALNSGKFAKNLM